MHRQLLGFCRITAASPACHPSIPYYDSPPTTLHLNCQSLQFHLVPTFICPASSFVAFSSRICILSHKSTWASSNCWFVKDWLKKSKTNLRVVGQHVLQGKCLEEMTGFSSIHASTDYVCSQRWNRRPCTTQDRIFSFGTNSKPRLSMIIYSPV